MTVPVILVNGLSPPPLGLAANGIVTNLVSVPLTLASTAGITSLTWRVDAGPGCAVSGLTASPAAPFNSAFTPNGVGSYRITAIANNNAAGNEIAVAGAYVPTTIRALRIPIIGETTEFDPTNSWHSAVSSWFTALDQFGDTTSSWAAGKAVSVYGTIQTTNATPSAANGFSFPLTQYSGIVDGTTVDLAATVIGRDTSGNSYRADLSGLYKRVSGGGPTLIGTTPTPINVRADSALTACACAFGITSNYVGVSVTGIAATTINWTCVLQTLVR